MTDDIDCPVCGQPVTDPEPYDGLPALGITHWSVCVDDNCEFFCMFRLPDNGRHLEVVK